METKNCKAISYGKDHSMTPESLKRSNIEGGKRQVQPRQNPLMACSPRSSTKVQHTPSQNNKKYGKNSLMFSSLN